jgi:hypothetical protein
MWGQRLVTALNIERPTERRTADNDYDDDYDYDCAAAQAGCPRYYPASSGIWRA